VTGFTAEAYQNEYLAAGSGQVHAVVTVTSTVRSASPPRSGSAPSSPAAEILIVDVSGSMDQPRAKLKGARRATAAAIDCLEDGTLFGVVAGSEHARRVYPLGDRLALATPDSRAAAKAALRRLRAEGGTAMGRWLLEAEAWFAQHPSARCHAILLTDGINESESPEELRDALGRCEGSFQCDCRGVGVDWRVAELREIASALLGSVDIVAEPQALAADFTKLMRAAIARHTADVVLRVWVPRDTRVAFLRQVLPNIEDLTARGVRRDDHTVDFPTGAWGAESRDYHVGITVVPRDVDDSMLAGRISLVVDGEVAAQSLVKVTWTDDAALSTVINPHVAHYTGQAELAAAISAGLEARKAGDATTATMMLGRATLLAADSGNEGTLRLLAKVVDIEDAPTGTVRLRRDVQALDEMELDTRSTRTVRVRPH
jgi:hypothetical protein